MVLLHFLAFSQNHEKYLSKELVVGRDTLKYRILYPENFCACESYPVVFFLHGSGERGGDNQKQLTWGADVFLDSTFRKNHPAIVIFPQCPQGERWFDNNNYEALREDIERTEMSDIQQSKVSIMLDNLIDSTQKWTYVDTDRYYIVGLSMGGFGIYELLSRRPDTFAAAVPICGGGVLKDAKRYAENVSIWIFHGQTDDVVNVEYSRKMYDKLKSLGADVQYTEFPGVTHNSWTPAFATEGLMDWIFSK